MSLFHRAGEDRVQSATMAVLGRADLAVVRDLMAEAGGVGEDLRGVMTGAATMRSAARITAHHDWSFEIVASRGVFEVEGPARDRVRRLAAGLEPDGWLFVLTPDPPVPTWLVEPDQIDEGARRRTVWISFAWLAAAAHDLLGDPVRSVDPRTRVLLAELLALYDAEGLLDGDAGDDAWEPDADDELDPVAAVSSRRHDTLVVTEPGAWSDYLDHAVYLGDPGRALPGDVGHLAFHHAGRIMAVLPRILEWHADVDLSAESVARLRAGGHGRAAAGLERIVTAGREGRCSLVLLSAAGHAETVRLAGPIDDPGTTGHRLTSLDALVASS